MARPRFTHPRPLALALCLLATLLLAPASAPTEEIVNALKAEYIERFPQYIGWPDDSPVESDTSAPFVIGVYGDSEILPALQRIAERSRIKGKQVETRRISSVSAVDSCHIVFVAGSHKGQLSEILSRTKGKPILTIGDTSGFAKSGIMINFTVDGSKVRFEINQDSAAASGLRLAPKLLALGKVI